MTYGESRGSVEINARLLDWIRQRVQETGEQGSIYIGIEGHRITWINYEKNSRFHPLGESSSGGPQSCAASGN